MISADEGGYLFSFPLHVWNSYLFIGSKFIHQKERIILLDVHNLTRDSFEKKLEFPGELTLEGRATVLGN